MTSTATRLAARRPGDRLPPLRLPTPLATDSTHSITWRWVVTRSLTLMLLVGLERDVTGDVVYYGRSLAAMFDGGNIHNTLIEYPPPVLILLLGPFLLGGLNQVAFGILFVVGMLAVDATFTAVLWRADGRRRGPAVDFWLWFVPCVGPLAYFRFDLVPAALAGAAVLAAARRPAWCAVLTATGAALKLWPALMAPIFLLRRGDRRRVVVSFAAAGAVYLFGSLAVAGFDRTLSPVRWQSARGLQIESVPATPLMLVRGFSPSHWNLRVSRYKAWEIFGPGVSFFTTLATVAGGLGVVTLAVLWWRADRAPLASGATLGWMLFATALVITITNKTLSPQYILWLGGPVAGLLCRDGADPVVRRAGALVLTTALATQLLFPILYHQLTHKPYMVVVATLILVVRNGLLVYLTWLACHQVWVTSRPDRSIAPGASVRASA
ncbi:MAG: glycosyltransferase 87 family protein [Actinomycetota bacterium]|nr:glycosyltransferase 87 family protein [Actinomycetota bacterium]